MGALDNYQWQEKDVYLNSVYLFSKRPVATLGGFPGLKPEAIVGALPCPCGIHPHRYPEQS